MWCELACTRMIWVPSSKWELSSLKTEKNARNQGFHAFQTSIWLELIQSVLIYLLDWSPGCIAQRVVCWPPGEAYGFGEIDIHWNAAGDSLISSLFFSLVSWRSKTSWHRFLLPCSSRGKDWNLSTKSRDWNAGTDEPRCVHYGFRWQRIGTGIPESKSILKF